MKKFLIILFVLIVSALVPLNLLAQNAENFRQEGIASWYGREFEGRPTASGEIFDSSQLTAAHPSLPFGTMVVVTNQHNNKSVIVRINDRGPFVSARIIDISRAAAEQIDMIVTGTAPVSIMSIDRISVSNPNQAEVPAVGAQVSPQTAAVIPETPAAVLAEAEFVFSAQPVVVQPPSASQFKLTPEINIETGKIYRLQIGSYKNARNAIDAFARLSSAGLSPSYERFVNANNEEFYRVVLAGITGAVIQQTTEKLRAAGFSEALIRTEN